MTTQQSNEDRIQLYVKSRIDKLNIDDIKRKIKKQNNVANIVEREFILFRVPCIKRKWFSVQWELDSRNLLHDIVNDCELQKKLINLLELDFDFRINVEPHDILGYDVLMAWIDTQTQK